MRFLRLLLAYWRWRYVRWRYDVTVDRGDADSITLRIELPADASIEDVHIAASEVALRASDLCKAMGGKGLKVSGPIEWE